MSSKWYFFAIPIRAVMTPVEVLAPRSDQRTGMTLKWFVHRWPMEGWGVVMEMQGQQKEGFPLFATEKPPLPHSYYKHGSSISMEA